jgi:Fe2+ or Zn2+ uptake regulation protein
MDTQIIRRRLVERGIRPTSQRIAVAGFVLGRADHPTAEAIKEHLDGSGAFASLATVYNTLELFVAQGLLRAFKLPHTDKVVYDDNVLPHHHFIDAKSGALVDVPAEMVRVKADLGKDFEIDEVQVVFTGRLRRPRRK